MTYSIVIPARNEAGSIHQTITDIHRTMLENEIEHEIIVVDDGSTDNTHAIVKWCEFARIIRNGPPHGFGRSVITGLRNAQGFAVVVMMADGSDDPKDAVVYWNLIQAGFDCAFGSRFIQGSRVENYPWLKLIINRAANYFIKCLFGIRYNDITNAFKAYRTGIIDRTHLESNHFELTVELPLKMIAARRIYAVTPISWRGRTSGQSKLKIKEMGSRYLKTVLNIWWNR